MSAFLTANLPPSGGLHILVIFLIGIIVGFLSGLLGKGGSALSTPALQIFADVPAFLALASPLPSSLANSISGSWAYTHEHLVNKRVVVISVIAGLPATIAGAFVSPLIGGHVLMLLTAVFVCGLGLSFLFPLVMPRGTLTPAPRTDRPD
jgi:uncharacterized membrane protein YfcA